MHFQEFTERGYRIYVGAMESPIGDGYTAALVVRREASHATCAGRDAYRDDLLACGHRWASAEEALAYALRKGRELIRRKPEALAC
jgi:hypothetical protein